VFSIGSTHDAKDLRYIEAVDDKWGFQSTSLGIASRIDDNITLAAQLFADDEGVTLDSSAIKFGKIKYAGNLYAETIEVGFIYPWVRAPESVYSKSSGLFIEAYEGASYKFTSGDDTEFAQDEHEDLSSQDRTGWFVTAAYTFGNWKPHLTFQDFSVDNKSLEQSSITLGLNRKMGNSAVLKLEV